MSTTISLAGSYAAIGRFHFETDGSVAPVLALHGGVADILLMPAMDCHPTDAFGFLLRATYGALRPTHVVTVSEAWARAYAEVDAPDDMARGFLESVAAQDPEVRTCVIVTAFDVADPSLSAHVMSTVRGDPTSPQWDTEVHHELMPGDMVDMLMSSVATAMPDFGFDVDTILGAFADQGLAHGMVVGRE